MPEALFPGQPGWTRDTCLGCGKEVIAARHPHVLIAGRRDGSGLVVIGLEAHKALAEDADALLEGDGGRFLLGVAHRECLDLARQRLKSGAVSLPDLLAEIAADEIDELPEEFHLPPTGAFCPFCGSDEALTEEHVWPQWFSRSVRERIGAKPHDRPFRTSEGSRVFEISTTAPACERCNHRWLSVLEQDVRPILEPMAYGEACTLNPSKQRALAVWAMKTALTLDMSRGGEAITPMGYFRELHNTRLPLESAVVWIGGYEGDKVSIAWSHPLWIDETRIDQPSGLITTLTVGRVVFQIAQHFVTEASFRDKRSLGSALERIWPLPPGSIRWPPKQVFNDESLARLARSWEVNPAKVQAWKE